jgi:hypothetical protein
MCVTGDGVVDAPGLVAEVLGVRARGRRGGEEEDEDEGEGEERGARHRCGA